MFVLVGMAILFASLLTLALLFLNLVHDGAARFGWDFFTHFPSRNADRAGILSAWVGTCLVMLVTVAGRDADRRRRRDLPRGVRAEELADGDHRDQRHQPGRRAVDHLRPAGAGLVRLQVRISARASCRPA